MPGPSLDPTAPARGRGNGGGLGDRVSRRGVRDHLGQRADRDDGAGRHPSVHPCQASKRRVARKLCSVAPHPWW
ncbi:MAG TPA: hypothetical protein VFI54_13255 [Solirubrobacteraceae bacterium]|nr:hypothetical protein [Solirubrobacteraceae bacterium]